MASESLSPAKALEALLSEDLSPQAARHRLSSLGGEFLGSLTSKQLRAICSAYHLLNETDDSRIDSLRVKVMGFLFPATPDSKVASVDLTGPPKSRQRSKTQKPSRSSMSTRSSRGSKSASSKSSKTRSKLKDKPLHKDKSALLPPGVLAHAHLSPPAEEKLSAPPSAGPDDKLAAMMTMMESMNTAFDERFSALEAKASAPPTRAPTPHQPHWLSELGVGAREALHESGLAADPMQAPQPGPSMYHPQQPGPQMPPFRQAVPSYSSRPAHEFPPGPPFPFRQPMPSLHSRPTHDLPRSGFSGPSQGLFGGGGLPSQSPPQQRDQKRRHTAEGEDYSASTFWEDTFNRYASARARVDAGSWTGRDQMKREAITLAVSLDLLARGHFVDAQEVLVRRLTALEIAAARGGRKAAWKLAANFESAMTAERVMVDPSAMRHALKRMKMERAGRMDSSSDSDSDAPKKGRRGQGRR